MGNVKEALCQSRLWSAALGITVGIGFTGYALGNNVMSMSHIMVWIGIEFILFYGYILGYTTTKDVVCQKVEEVKKL